jgi:carbonic anhydrase
MFSVEEFDAIEEVNNKTFQDFFRQFEFDNHEDKVAPFFQIGKALNAIDYEQRWVYKGGISEPPCTQYVYWNVVRRIYPIEIERFQWYKDFMYSKKKYLGTYKNNRKIQDVHVEKHLVSYVSAVFFKKAQIFIMLASSLMAYTMMY